MEHFKEVLNQPTPPILLNLDQETPAQALAITLDEITRTEVASAIKSLKNGKAPKKNIYYNSQNIKSIKTQIIYEDNKPRRIVLDYKMDVEGDGDFVLSYQPWTLAEFSSLLKVMSLLVKLFIQ